MHCTSTLLTFLAATSLAAARGHGWYVLPPGTEAGSQFDNPFAPQRPSETQATIHFEDGTIGRTFLFDTKTMETRLTPEDARWLLQENAICPVGSSALSVCSYDPK